jgi:SAM-dependent methyltransferase
MPDDVDQRAPSFPFEVPAPPNVSLPPRWTGRGFDCDGTLVPVLVFEVGDSGWTDDLNKLHEQTSGGRHPMDLASRKNALLQIKQWLEAPGTVMEVGCSAGLFLKDLRRVLPQHFVVGSDYTLPSLRRLASANPDFPLFQFDLTRSPIPSCTLDAIVLLNVLEHIEDDAAALREAFRMLKPGGVAVIEVPAGRNLFDVYDRHLMHYRRYSMSELGSSVAKAGFDIVYRSHLGAVAYPMFWIAKKINRLRYPARRVDEESIVTRAITVTQKYNILFKVAQVIEDWVREIVYVPFGIRCLITCRKPVP